MGVTAEELAEAYPLLYHMADARSWDSIRKHGLLSTSALCWSGPFGSVKKSARRSKGDGGPKVSK